MLSLVIIKVNTPPSDEWVSENGTNCYYDSEGNVVTGWVQISPEEGAPNDEEWCYFDENGNYVASFDENKQLYTGVFVDISEQMAYYFDDGKIKLSANIISGTKGESDTPTGKFEINSKNKDARITGATWDYDHVIWMAFIGQEYGLHSAWWQDDALFDDPTSYYTNGSHGCINMREKDAAALYDLVDKGTKVVIQE